jgi:hypothetical protein
MVYTLVLEFFIEKILEFVFGKDNLKIKFKQ